MDATDPEKMVNQHNWDSTDNYQLWPNRTLTWHTFSSQNAKVLLQSLSQTAGNFYPMHPEKTCYTGFSLIQIMLFQSEYPWPKWQPLELWNLVFSITDKYNTEQGSRIFCLDSRGDMIGYHNTGPGLGICGLVTKLNSIWL